MKATLSKCLIASSGDRNNVAKGGMERRGLGAGRSISQMKRMICHNSGLQFRPFNWAISHSLTRFGRGRAHLAEKELDINGLKHADK